MTKSNLWIQGIYRDVVEDAQRNVVHDSGWISNTITTDCRKLLASFIKNDPGGPAGIRYLAVGQGESSWDDDGAPAPNPDTTTSLKDMYEPPIDVAELEVVYLTDGGAVSPDPTRRIRIKATLKDDYPAPLAENGTYPLREFGLFGELGGVPYMINCVRHPRIDKHKSETLTREIVLSF